jgi:hypothetical protein
MRSIVMYFESLQVPQEEMETPLKPITVTPRLSPFLLNYMKKDLAFTTEVQANLKNYENIAKMRSRHLIKQ